jgi:hybrid cluster-associated redox disulfide protein
MANNLIITSETVIADILSKCPHCIDVFNKHEMPCQSCMGVSTDTLAEGAMMHDVDLEALIAELKVCVSDCGS